MSANRGSTLLNNPGNRSPVVEPSKSDPVSGDDEVVEPDQGNGLSSPIYALPYRLYTDRASLVLSHIISQLRPGADLSRVVLPTFILEPRSMLERITKYVPLPYRSDTSPTEWHD